MAVAEVETQRIIAHALPAEHLDAGKTLRSVAAVAISQDVALPDI